ncbi:unnamed protein product [Rhizoctonia solani]|uniref:F-box domain-containing protein n=1 Tax=Rhizoctonia solani TaxID=456999 RepID=A0A8H3DY81_9AGAM|nr:unnamed protein product [Rhizoctonia solani]
MAPQTRSRTSVSGVKTRASSARTRSSRKVEAPRSPKPIQKRKPTLKHKPKPKPKSIPEPTPESKSEPPRKRTRRLDSKGGQHAHKLGLKNMPVEVLIEIARYVHPLDLIMLSRVNKFFRELFVDKRSARIWQSAMHNLPTLPPCPDDVCEPQYAAMIFTKRCSLCGRYAPREMDSVLLVRLCARCRDRELVDTNRVTDSSLVISSRGLVPGRSHRWTTWCLYDEARAVKIKLDELTKAGDQEALATWKEQRRKLVGKRQRIAEPLRGWLRNREREQERERNMLKATRETEIKSRLVQLGWEEVDFRCSDEWRYKQWKSMVYNPKPLTEKIWNDILPHLLGHLEVNRNHRLEQERGYRLRSRRSYLDSWFNQIEDQLSPFARASRTVSMFSTHMILYQASPKLSQMREWTEYKALVENDVPDEQFLVDFEEKKALFKDFLANWQRGLEKQLIRLLPDDTHPPDFTLLPFNNMVLDTGENVQPINTLPEGVQSLLRADTIFSSTPGGETSYFYPHDFHIFKSPIEDVYYHSEASAISRALLNSIDSPDASYLSLRAMGDHFRCGRCPQAVSFGLNWQELVQHYLEKIRLSKRIVQAHAQSNEGFVYICAHDIDSEKVDRPFVRVGGKPTRGSLTSSYCVPCRKLGLSYRESQQYSQGIVDHIRDVHLIEAPEAGTHYVAH